MIHSSVSAVWRQVIVSCLVACLLVQDSGVVYADDDPDASAKLSQATTQGLSWLMSQQSSDGGWHSETYGALRGGAAVTALSLYAVAHAPARLRENTRMDLQKGLDFLVQGIAKKGCVACPDGSLDYPTYSSALTLLALKRLKLTISKPHRQSLVDYLASAQLTEQNGFSPNNPHYGGWDLVGASGARGITSGTNISVSYFAVTALAAENNVPKELFRPVIDWSEACQNFPMDGGFYFHPEPMDLGNKAQWKDRQFKQPRSYGTTTCDGIGCLLSSGVGAKDPRVVAGLEWLEQQKTVECVPGFEKTPESLGFKEGLRFYYFQGLARTLRMLPKPVAKERREDLTKVLLDLQKKDGSWQNDSARMREDDPLIATCFALIALGHLQEEYIVE